MTKKRLTLVVAMGRNRVIGNRGKMPWHLPAELSHFKATTWGNAIVMGRKTWAAIGRPLPGRQNIVVTRNRDFDADGCDVVHSLEAAITAARSEEVMVVGGGELYRQALPLADRLVLTMVDCEPNGDTWFPEWDQSGWAELSRVSCPADEKNQYAFTVVEWARK